MVSTNIEAATPPGRTQTKVKPRARKRQDKLSDSKTNKLRKTIGPPSSPDGGSSLSRGKSASFREQGYPLGLQFRLAIQKYRMLSQLRGKLVEFLRIRHNPSMKETTLRLHNEIQILGRSVEIKELIGNTSCADPEGQIQEAIDMMTDHIFSLGLKLLIDRKEQIEGKDIDIFKEVVRKVRSKKSFHERKEIYRAHPSDLLKNLFTAGETILFGHELLQSAEFDIYNALISEEDIIAMADPDRRFLENRDYQEAIYFQLHHLLESKCLNKSEDPSFVESFQELVVVARCLPLERRIAFFNDHAMRKRPLFDLFTTREKEEILFSNKNPLPVIRKIHYGYFLTPKDYKHFALSLIHTSKLFDIIPFSYFLIFLCGLPEVDIGRYGDIFIDPNDQRNFLRETLLRGTPPEKLFNQRQRMLTVANRIFN